MTTILWIIGGLAVLFGVITLLSSNKSDPKERASEALGAAAGGAAMGVGCILQLIIPALMLLAGLWLLAKIFGN